MIMRINAYIDITVSINTISIITTSRLIKSMVPMSIPGTAPMAIAVTGTARTA
ncbi:hypothetical protein [Vulcanisaeta sp. JCM 14467]|uniref:hypothetical protein n=1 Tax=Vulcanisaeta sp. JCM 14467 TaxID=1295370 RepID=UPI000A89F864|nr:hypothetical protein [Vulcanisaeta sp. JCM 14467]